MEKPPPAKDKKSTRSKKASSNNKFYTLGPVDNLEEHVKGDWWKRILTLFTLKLMGM